MADHSTENTESSTSRRFLTKSPHRAVAYVLQGHLKEWLGRLQLCTLTQIVQELVASIAAHLKTSVSLISFNWKMPLPSMADLTSCIQTHRQETIKGRLLKHPLTQCVLHTQSSGTPQYPGAITARVDQMPDAGCPKAYCTAATVL